MTDKNMLIESLRNREYSRSARFHRAKLPRIVEIRTDKVMNNVMKLTIDLRKAIANHSWDQIHTAVSDIMHNLLESSGSLDSKEKKQQRELFVSMNGLQLLASLLSPPFTQADARNMTDDALEDRAEVLNEVMLVLREIGYVNPIVSENIYSDGTIVFLFTALSKSLLFDGAINLLEEIVAYREEVFELHLVPNLYKLLNGLSARCFVQFCRLLSLLIFEPEDRQIMEGGHMLQSTELLQLRRNRMAKNSTSVVERNQCVLLDMPGFLERMVQALSVISYGPTVAQYMKHNISSNIPLGADILSFKSSECDSEWAHFEHLQRLVVEHATATASITVTELKTTTDGVYPSTSSSSGAGSIASSANDDDSVLEELLAAFSVSRVAPGMQTQMDIHNLIHILQFAQRFNIASLTPLGYALLSQPSAISHALQRSPRSTNKDDPIRAKRELQFHAMMLLPNQVELIFVLCTLLSGRRKLLVQDRLTACGIGKVLTRFNNMILSWSAPPTFGKGSGIDNSMDHVHGPYCECNPESALRIQVLRLIHNFVDRDFLGNNMKLQFLTEEEQESLQSIDKSPEDANVPFHTESGTLLSLIDTLVHESSDSVYRFWICACIENFLRGAGNKTQTFIASHVVVPSKSSPAITFLRFLCLHVINVAPSHNNTYQTSFDLLSELTKSNRTVILMIEECLSREEFDKLWTIISSNLVDSNVFLRSLMFSMELMKPKSSLTDSHCDNNRLTSFSFNSNCLRSQEDMFLDVVGSVAEPQLRLFYLSHSYVQFTPQTLSRRAIDVHTHKKTVKSVGKRKQKVVSSLSRGDYSYSNTSSSSSSSSGYDLSSKSPAVDGGIRGVVQRASRIFQLTFTSSKSANANDNNSSSSSSSNSNSSSSKPRSEYVDAEDTYHSPSDSELDETSIRNGKMSLKYFNAHEYNEQYHVTDQKVPTVSHTKFAHKIEEERINILMKLFCVVSLETVTHETICCLNSTLLILLIEESKGNLVETLNSIRAVANEEYQRLKRKDSFDIDDLTSNSYCTTCNNKSVVQCSESSNSSNSSGSSGCQCKKTLKPSDSLSNLLLNFDRSVCINNEEDTEASEGIGAKIVMTNFRRLLWYWSEYYLRRGRDRLSMEFSNHIPFRHWGLLVDSLCRDDGSDTSLLKKPVKLANSPFSRQPVCKINRLINYTI